MTVWQWVGIKIEGSLNNYPKLAADSWARENDAEDSMAIEAVLLWDIAQYFYRICSAI